MAGISFVDTPIPYATMPHAIEDIEKAQKDFHECGAIPLHSYWKHYKGEVYEVVGFVMKESTEEMQVCYTSVAKPYSTLGVALFRSGMKE